MNKPEPLTPEQMRDAVRLPNRFLPCGIGSTEEQLLHSCRAVEATVNDKWQEMLSKQEPVAECVDDGEGGVYYKTLSSVARVGKLYATPVAQPAPEKQEDSNQEMLKALKDVLETVKSWNNDDDLTWIQYRLPNIIARAEAQPAQQELPSNAEIHRIYCDDKSAGEWHRHAENYYAGFRKAWNMRNEMVAQQFTIEELADYERLEREHMGDPDKKTGIYSQPAQQEQVREDDADWKQSIDKGREILASIVQRELGVTNVYTVDMDKVRRDEKERGEKFLQGLEKPIAADDTGIYEFWARNKEQERPPGMAVQALAGEIIEALKTDEKHGGYDLTAGLFGTEFSKLVRRWAAAEWGTSSNPLAIKAIIDERNDARGMIRSLEGLICDKDEAIQDFIKALQAADTVEAEDWPEGMRVALANLRGVQG